MSRYVSSVELSSVNPAVLSAMLTRAGWRELLGKPGILQVLESPDAETDISIPLNPDFRDYPTRLNEALTGAELALGERARPFMLQLLAGPMDELLFEQNAQTVYGSIEWRLGEQLHEIARQTCRAAAKSSEQHLPYFGVKGLGAANRFMDKVRMGQTEVGSYVVTALVPLHGQDVAEPRALFGREDLGEPGGGFFRGVTANLMQAAEAAVYAAQEFESTDSVEPFADMVEYGLSADLLDALSKLSESGQEAEIRAVWSPLVGEPEHISTVVEVHPDHLAAFAQAAIRFKEAPPPISVTIRGTVTNLERRFAGQSGTSTLDVISGISAKRVRVRLSASQYEAAIEAHRIGDVLEVTGEQSRVGNLYWLYNVRDTRLVQRQLDLEEDSGT
jgi:hypothetical protein